MEVKKKICKDDLKDSVMSLYTLNIDELNLITDYTPKTLSEFFSVPVNLAVQIINFCISELVRRGKLCDALDYFKLLK